MRRIQVVILLVVIPIAAVLFLTAMSPSPDPKKNTDTVTRPGSELPIFDTHVHYKKEAWTLFSPKEVLELFKRSGVTKALVSSSPDEGTRMLYKLAPDMIVPFLRPYHDDVNSSNWFKKQSILDYFKKRLELPIYKGIGEFHIHNEIDADSPVILETLRLAVKEDLYIHVHTGHEAVEAMFKHEPKIKVLWAHAGMSDPPQVVSAMFDRYKNLWVDISIRENDIAPGGVLSPEWKALFLKHPDRITVGSDTWVNSRWQEYEEIIKFDRGWLAQLPSDVARKIAYDNAGRLFGNGDSGKR